MLKIVILDGAREVRQLAENTLSLDGHIVRTTSNSAEAIDLAHLFEPDLLIADWDLESDYKGTEVAEAFQAAVPNIKTIVASKHRSIQMEFSHHALTPSSNKLGIVDSLAKPFSTTALTRVVLATIQRFNTTLLMAQ